MQRFFLREVNQTGCNNRKRVIHIVFVPLKKRPLIVLVRCKPIPADPALFPSYRIVTDTTALHFLEPYQRQRI